ncbi:outer membrane protein [Putridiphycobacter roseus]|nr:outer membrane beta-barrel protein [Putridiphycobacter roseus]
MIGILGYGQENQDNAGDFQFGVRLNQNINLPQYEEGFGIGVQAKVNVLDNLNIEIYSNIETLDLGNVGNLKQNEFGFSAVVPFLNHKLSPFIFLGANYSNIKVTPVSYLFSNRESESIALNSFGLHAGIGAQYNLNDRLSIALSYRFLYRFDQPIYEVQSSDFGLYLNTAVLPNTEIESKDPMYLQFSLNYRIMKLWN